MSDIVVNLDAQDGFSGLGDAVTFSWLAESGKSRGKIFHFVSSNLNKIGLLSVFNQNRTNNKKNAVSTALHYKFELDNVCNPSRLEILKELFEIPGCANVRPKHSISDRAMQWAADMHARITYGNEKFVMLFPGASYKSRQYPINYWCDIAWALVRNNVSCAVFDASYSEALEKFPRWFYGIAMEDLAALVKRADLVVCNDSFPAHFSGTLGVATLALLGPSSPNVYMHVPDVHTLSSSRIECTGCHFAAPFRASCDIGCLSLFRLFPEEVLGRIFYYLGIPMVN